jgi:hypothetical protein
MVAIDLDHFIDQRHPRTRRGRQNAPGSRETPDLRRARDRRSRQAGWRGVRSYPFRGRDRRTPLASAERAGTAIAEISIGERALTASAGIATCPENSQDAGRLLELAGCRAVLRQEAGRNRCQRHTGLQHPPLIARGTDAIQAL